jgi:uncharacterized membrane protein YebE (DUF533 family)
MYAHFKRDDPGRRDIMEKPSKSAAGLKELINAAISDLEVTPEEYQRIMDHAQADGYLDKEETALLAQFHEMINNGTVKRVRG